MSLPLGRTPQRFDRHLGHLRHPRQRRNRPDCKCFNVSVAASLQALTAACPATLRPDAHCLGGPARRWDDAEQQAAAEAAAMEEARRFEGPAALAVLRPRPGEAAPAMLPPEELDDTSSTFTARWCVHDSAAGTCSPSSSSITCSKASGWI